MNYYQNYKGIEIQRVSKNLETYLKQVWMGNGIHHHYSEEKFNPAFTEEFLSEVIDEIDASLLPLLNNEDVKSFKARIFPVIFDEDLYAKRMNQEAGVDLILTSANNFYEGVTQSEVEAFYAAKQKPNDHTPVPYGLNSKVVKDGWRVVEQTYKLDGMYGAAIERIIYWLAKAATVAENEQQKAVIIH